MKFCGVFISGTTKVTQLEVVCCSLLQYSVARLDASGVSLVIAAATTSCTTMLTDVAPISISSITTLETLVLRARKLPHYINPLYPTHALLLPAPCVFVCVLSRITTTAKPTTTL